VPPVFGVFAGRGFGPDGAGCGHGTGMVFGWGLLMSGFGVFGRLSGISTGLLLRICVTPSSCYVRSGLPGERRADQGLSPSRIRQAHVVLSKMLKPAVRRNKLSFNAADGCETLPSLRQEEAPYFHDSTIVDKIAAAADAWGDSRGKALGYGLFIQLQGTFGLRFGEAAALRRRSVDLLSKPPRLHITESLSETGGHLDFNTPKTHATRWVPLSPDLAAAVEAHAKEIIPEGGELRL
jgi:integrase